MNKIKNVIKLGVIMSALAVLVTVGVASAALVNYLSDNVKATADIVSPIVMNINSGRDGSENANKSIDVSTTGGSDFTFTTVAKNNANNTIKGYRVVVAKAPTGKNFTGGEINGVMMEVAYLPGVVTDITDYLYVVYSDGSLHKLTSWTGDSNKLVLITSEDSGITATQASLDAGEVDWNVFTITTNSAIAPGTYKVSSEFTVNLAEFAASQY